MSINLYIPFLNAVVRKPDAQVYSLKYKGEKVGEIRFNFKHADQVWTRIQKFPPPKNYATYYPAHVEAKIDSVDLSLFVRDPKPEITDFTLGAEGDDRLLDFHWDGSAEQKADAQAIFQSVFGGNWATLGKWIYVTPFLRVLRKGVAGYTYVSFKPSKVLKINYTYPPHYDSEGELYQSDDEEASFEKGKFVFLADGKLLDISKYNGKRVYDVPADLKLENVQLGRIPLIWWLLMMRPTEFRDTSEPCLALKKMIQDQFDVRFPAYYCKQMWLMTGDEMVKMRVYSTKVFVDGRQISLDEVRALMDRKNDIWMGGLVLRKLFTNP